MASLIDHYRTSSLLGKQKAVGPIPPEKELYGRFLRLAWPSVVESALVALVGIMDTIMVSSMGDLAIDAVGICNQPKFVLLCVLFALNTGVTAVVARRKGAGDQESANRTLRSALLLGTLLILCLSALGILFARPILEVAGAHESYIEDAEIYFRIICVSLVFQSLNNLINAAQKGCGNTRISMTTNMIGNLVNICFNYLLINGIGPFPRWGIKGAAVATVIGTFVAFTISLAKLFRRNGYLSVFFKAQSSWRISREVMEPVMKVTRSALVEQLCIRTGFFLFNMVVAKLSPLDYATHTICINMMSLSFCIGDGFQVAATSLAGQNLGAKRPDLANIFCNIGRRIVVFVAILLSAVFIIFGKELMGLYTETPEVIEKGRVCLVILSLITYAQTDGVVCSGCLRGAGDTRYVARISLLTIAVVRPITAYLMTYPLGMGLYGAWASILIDQGLRMLLYGRRVNQGKWVSIKL